MVMVVAAELTYVRRRTFAFQRLHAMPHVSDMMSWWPRMPWATAIFLVCLAMT